jgi:hypothetical protein
MHDLCFVHDQLLKIKTPSPRVTDCIAKVEDTICTMVEGLESVQTIPNRAMGEMVATIKRELDKMGVK